MRSLDTLLPISKLDSVTFDTLLERQNPFQSTNCTFDLTGVQFITPCALVQLVVACHSLGRYGRQPTIIVDDKKVRCIGYLVHLFPKLTTWSLTTLLFSLSCDIQSRRKEGLSLLQERKTLLREKRTLSCSIHLGELCKGWMLALPKYLHT
jgi:anti-anti-sigma regulatory factor